MQIVTRWSELLTSQVRHEIVRSLLKVADASIAELERNCHASKPTLRRHLSVLVELGLVHERSENPDGLKPGPPARRFCLYPDARAAAAEFLEIVDRPIDSSPRRTPWPVRGRGKGR